VGSPLPCAGRWLRAARLSFFALLPALFSNWPNLLINALYIAVLILIIVIDLEHRLILDVVTLPMTGLALLFSLALTSDQNTIGLAVVGAVTGFVLFYFAYWIGQIMFGPGALGFGDVKLALLMGAMLGFHRIIFALILGILLGGLISALLLASRRFSRNQFLPYGQYLALAGIVMILWGVQIVNWYIG
jgi:leader peptidase (prepilin peptidase) / N-methyltransferase